MAEEKTVRCTACAAEFSDEELERHTLNVDGPDGATCPKCKSPSVPMSIAQDVTIKINWHELRILTIWASNYAEKLPAHSKATLAAILRRLDAQKPNDRFAALTLAGEIRALQEAGFDAELLKGDGTVVAPRKGPAS